MVEFKELIEAALGKRRLSIFFKNVSLVNVYTCEVYKSNVGILDDRICYVGEDNGFEASEVVDGKDMFLIPGLIDSHLHIESSMVTPWRFAEAVLPHGVTTAVADPHEIANVLGVEGVKTMIENSRGLNLKLYFWAPTCVPSLPGFEQSGAEITAEDVVEMLKIDGVLGLGEVMDYSGVVNLSNRIMNIVRVGLSFKVPIDGHAPMLKGRVLNAYLTTGVEADHENFTVEEVVEKARLGIWVKIRRHLAESKDFIMAVKSSGAASRLILATDDTSPDLLVERGHLDGIVRSAIENGLDPVEAIQAATIRPAQHLRLYDRGGIAPGKLADLILLKNLEKFEIVDVYSNGKLIVRNGKLIVQMAPKFFPEWARRTVKTADLKVEDFMVKAPVQRGSARVNIIEVRGFETRLREDRLPVENGFIQLLNYALAVVVERHGKTGGMAKALIDGLNIKGGAIASTVAHDSHNMVILGKSPFDMLKAWEALRRAQGGYVAVLNGEVLSILELPVAGLMSEEPVEKVAEQFREFRRAERKLGLEEEAPIPLISLLTLPVIPHVRITDRGLFDVDKGELIPLIKEVNV
ncbi:MAG: adenine deaminase [Candidatus Bathyarchaeia archaeon]